LKLECVSSACPTKVIWKHMTYLVPQVHS
jgi:hypothetical protein